MASILGGARPVPFVIIGALAFASTAHCQDKILYGVPNRPQDVTVITGKIVDENQKRIVIKQANGANKEIAADGVVEVYYQPPAGKANARATYEKAEATQQEAARTMGDAKRKQLLTEAIKLYTALQKDVADTKLLKRHVQFKIASLSAQRARGDRDQTLEAIDLLEKFQKDNPDSWQNHFAAKLLEELKGKGK
jgi:hypothetical protein